MRLRSQRLTFAGLTAGLCVCLFVLAGCSSSQFGSELTARPKPQPVGKPAPSTIRLPQQRAFSIALPKVTKQAGLDGTAEGNANVDNMGSAELSAAVTNSGTAVSNFQLGHAFENDSDQQADFEFVVRCHHAFDAGATPPTPYPDAQVGLKLYARDSQGRLVRDMTLLQYTTEAGATANESDETLRFTITVGPADSVSVFLAGQVKVEIREGRSAHGTLKLSGLTMELTSRLAPPVTTTSQP